MISRKEFNTKECTRQGKTHEAEGTWKEHSHPKHQGLKGDETTTIQLLLTLLQRYRCFWLCCSSAAVHRSSSQDACMGGGRAPPFFGLVFSVPLLRPFPRAFWNLFYSASPAYISIINLRPPNPFGRTPQDHDPRGPCTCDMWYPFKANVYNM